MIVGASGV
jgi:hypothetical protein